MARRARERAGAGYRRGDWSEDYTWVGRRHRHHHHGGHHLARRLKHLRRNPDNRVLGGVCGALSESFGVDVTWVRIGVVVLSLFTGVAILPYALAWLLIPMRGEDTSIFHRAVNDRGGIRLLIALVPVLIVVQIVVSSLHLGYLGLIGWPTILAVGIGVLIWRNAGESERTFLHDDIVPLVAQDTAGHGRRVVVIRVVLGALVGLVGVALLVMDHRYTTAATLRPVGGAVLVMAAVVIIFGPWWLSLVRDLIAERQARALAEERTQMAAHVHDSVLQTLALIQRSADDPQNVVRLARSQERELRAWLFEGRAPGTIGEEAVQPGRGRRARCSARSRRTTASRSRWCWSVSASSTRPCAPCSMPPARPPSTQPSGPGPTRSRSTPRSRRTGSRSSCATGATASTPTRCPRGARASPSRSGPAWPASAARPSSAPLPGEGAEVQLSMPRARAGQVSPEGRPRVFLVEDHAMFRAGVKSELGDAVEVVGEADEAAAAVELICERLPDVVLLDVHLPGGGGHAVLRGVLPDHPGVQFLALSVSDAPEDVIEVIRAGARGYVTKTISGPELLQAVYRVRRRRRRVLAAPGRIRARRLRPAGGVGPAAGLDPELDQLSPREREVLRLIARGYTYKEVGRDLSISAKTVESHVSSVLRKLQLSTRHELTRWATDRRLV